LVLFEIKEKNSKKTLIMLTTFKEFVLYKAWGREGPIACLLTMAITPKHTHTHTHTHTLSLSLSLSLSHHATRLSKKKVHIEVFIWQQQLGLSIGFWESDFFHLYFNHVNVFFGWYIVI
jgi:hypothetical protein